jgi:hypothetical protein
VGGGDLDADLVISSGLLKPAQRIAECDVPTSAGVSVAWLRPLVGAATSRALVDRGRGPFVAIGL